MSIGIMQQDAEALRDPEAREEWLRMAREEIESMLKPPLILAADDATSVAGWFTERAMHALVDMNNAGVRRRLSPTPTAPPAIPTAGDYGDMSTSERVPDPKAWAEYEARLNALRGHIEATKQRAIKVRKKLEGGPLEQRRDAATVANLAHISAAAVEAVNDAVRTLMAVPKEPDGWICIYHDLGREVVLDPARAEAQASQGYRVRPFVYIGAPVVETPREPDATQQDAEAMNRLRVLLAKLETAAWWDGRMDRSASADHIAAREAIVAHVRTLSVREPDAEMWAEYRRKLLEAMHVRDEWMAHKGPAGSQAIIRRMEEASDALDNAVRVLAGVRTNRGVNDADRN